MNLRHIRTGLDFSEDFQDSILFFNLQTNGKTIVNWVHKSHLLMKVTTLGVLHVQAY